MEYVYTTLILNELDSEVNERNITAVLEAAGAEDVSESRVKALVAALEGVDVDAVDPAPDPADEAEAPASPAAPPAEPGPVDADGDDGPEAEAEAEAGAGVASVLPALSSVGEDESTPDGSGAAESGSGSEAAESTAESADAAEDDGDG